MLAALLFCLLESQCGLKLPEASAESFACKHRRCDIDSSTPDPVKPQRNVAVDAYRGLVMLLMMAEVLRFSARRTCLSATALFWRILAFNQTHVEWTWFGLHDLIQPSFTFLVGVALPYSIRSRQRKGETFAHSLAHTIVRSIILIALGIFLRSINQPITYFTFEDTLTQIGMGYTFAFLLAFCKPRWQWTAFGVILFAYWLAWALYPLPPANFDYATVGVPPDWHGHLLHGFAAHWNKNVNLGQAFDVWFLNLFPRTSPFLYNGGGYLTLSFIPTLGTMLLGLAAGRWLIASPSQIPFRRFLIAGTALVAGRRPASRARHQPDRQTHLDTGVDALQRRPVLLSSCVRSHGSSICADIAGSPSRSSSSA